jgi:hypothetical protein
MPIIRGDFEFDLCGGCGKRFVRDMMMDVPTVSNETPTTCSSRVRPVDEPVGWNGTYARSVRFGAPMDQRAKEIFRLYGMTRDTFDFAKPWTAVAADTPLEYEWNSHAMDDGERRIIRFGWGGDVRCSTGPSSTVTRVPAGDYPLFG